MTATGQNQPNPALRNKQGGTVREQVLSPRRTEFPQTPSLSANTTRRR